MARANRGKPSGKYAESKKEPGRKGDYKRSGWPEEARTQRDAAQRGDTAGEPDLEQAQGRNRKAGSPI